MKNKKEKALNGSIIKEEMNIAEYPLTLLSKRIPKGKKTIEYNDWVTIGGRQVLLSWVVTGSDKYGLGTSEDQDFLIALMKIWHDNGFRDRFIPLPSIYAVLKEAGLPDTKFYRDRFKLSLDKLTGLYITAKNAFWDRKNRSYVTDIGFHIFNEYKINKDEKENVISGYIEVNEFFYESVVSGHLKNLDYSFYFKLPRGVPRRLYRYLDKQRFYGQTFTIGIYKLAGKLGLGTDEYYPSQLKRILVSALEALKVEGYLKEHSFTDEILTVVFTESAGTNDGSLITNEKDSEIKFMVENILGVTGDENSAGFYRMVAARCPEEIIYRALSEIKDSDRTSGVRNKGALFTHKIKKYSEEQGIII